MTLERKHIVFLLITIVSFVALFGFILPACMSANNDIGPLFASGVIFTLIGCVFFILV